MRLNDSSGMETDVACVLVRVDLQRVICESLFSPRNSEYMNTQWETVRTEFLTM